MTDQAQEVKQIYFYNTRKEMIPFIPPESKRILDIGCGGGNFCHILKGTLQAEIWGVELDPKAAGKATESLDHVIQGDFLYKHKELPDDYFDCIIMNDALEHFQDTGKILEICRRLLNDDGFLVCSIPNVRYVGNLYELIVKKDWEYKESGILDQTHLRFFTKKSILRVFQNSGYRIIKISGINPTHSLKVKLFNIVTFGFFQDIKFLEFAIVSKNTKRKPYRDI